MPEAPARSSPARSDRVDELGALRSSFAGAAAGRATTIVLTGAAGVGKSWLLDRFTAAVRDETSAVLRLRTHPAEQELPYAGLHQLLAPVGARLAALPGPQRLAIEGALALGPVPAGDAFAVASGLHRLLTDMAEAGPVLVVADDVQWLDGPTRQALFFAARRLDADRVAVVLAARSPHRPDLRSDRTVTIELEPLDEASSRALVRARFPAAALPAVEAIVAAAHGLPLALGEIPAELSDAQLRGDETLPRPLPVGSTLDALYAGRLAGLDDGEFLALLVTSLEPLRRDQLAAALDGLGLPPDVLDGPERAGLVRLGPDGPTFPHSVTAGAVQTAATEAMRRRAHQVLADVLRDDPSRRAHHLAVVVQGPDGEVARALSAAAADAERRGAWLVAGQAHEAAALRTPGGADRRSQRAAAGAYAHAGAAAPLERVLRELARSAEGAADRLAVEAELLATRVWSGAPGIDVSGARSLADRLGSEAPMEAARLRTVVAFALVISGRAPDARQDLDAARRLVPDPTQPVLAVTYDLLDAYLAGTAGSPRLAGWVATVTDAELVNPSLELVAATSTLLWSDEPERADALLARQCAALRTAGALGQLGVSEGLRAAIAQRQGDWAGAEARFLGAIDRCTDTDLTGPLPHIQLRYAYLLAAQGREAPCRALVAAARAADPGSLLLEHLGTCVLGLLELTVGRPAEARELLARAGGLERRAGINQSGYSSRAADLVEALWRLRDLDAAGREADALAAQAGQWGRAGPLAAAARCRALLGPDDDVASGFAAALAHHRTAVDVFDEARTELCWGRRLRREQRKREARPHLRTALDTFERLGADPWAAQARSELAACGERRSAGRSPTAELTPRELEVAVAVARGASNPQAAAELCISRRTVEDHLGRVYRKLGITDRGGLAAVLGGVGRD